MLRLLLIPTLSALLLAAPAHGQAPPPPPDPAVAPVDWEGDGFSDPGADDGFDPAPGDDELPPETAPLPAPEPELPPVPVPTTRTIKGTVAYVRTDGHVYMEVAGLRFDTSGVGDPSGRAGARWRPVIGRRPKFAARHIAGL